MRVICSIIGAAVLAGAAWSQATVWTYAPPAGHIDVSPGIGDLDGDGNVEIVVGTTAGLVVALNGAGTDLWRRETGASICIPPTVADVIGDTAPEVLVVNRQGRVLCLEGRTGAVIWDRALLARPEWGTTALAVGDLDGDGAPEIVTGALDGTVVCLRGSGEQAWAYHDKLGRVFCPAIADLDNDGQAEVLVGSDKVSLVCLSASGKERWRLDKGVGGSPFVCDLSGTGKPTILTGIGKALKALDATGKTLWSCPMPRELDSAITVADADGDGALEIYAVDLGGNLVCLSPDGKARWTANVQERVRRSPSVGDVDGDGKMEILVAGYSSAVHVSDALGHLRIRVPLPGPSNSTATLAVLGEAGLCVIVPVFGAPMQALRWQGTTPGAKVAWPEFRYNSRRTGALLPNAKKPLIDLTADFGGMCAGTNSLKAVVNNPERRKLTLRVEAVRSGGKSTVTEAASSEARVERQFPYTLSADDSGDLTLVCTVSEGKRILARRERVAPVAPFEKDISEAERIIAAVKERLPKLLDADGIEQRTFFVAAKLHELRPQVASAGASGDVARVAHRESLAAVLREARELDKLSALAAGVAAEGRTSVVRAANPWSPFGGTGDLAKNEGAQKELTVFAFGGETESAALNVFNISNRPRAYRVELEGLSQGNQMVPARDAVKLFEALNVPTERCDLSADALAALNAANVLQAPAWGARQLWLNVNTRALAPGEWKGAVVLRSLDVTPIEIRVPLTVTVWKTRLPEHQVLRNCSWGNVDASMLKDQPEEALNDQVAHGTNVFVATAPPKARFDAEGNLVGDVDFAGHDAYVKRHAPHGIILFCGYQGALAGPAGASAETYGKAHVQWLRTWVKHLADLGVGYDGFALYPVDEPGIEKGRVEEFLRLAKLAREADPNIQMYTDPVPGITTNELRAMTPYVDIWCPNRAGMVLDKTSAKKLAIIQACGKPVWTYECDDNGKHLSPLGYYRGQAWLAWKHGLTGIGFWTYCTSPDDPWFVPRARYDYLLVYPGNGVVASKRWEAVRDGIEDYGALTMLKQAIATKGASAKPEDLEAAKRVIGQQAANVAAFCIVPDKMAPLGADEIAIRSGVADRQWTDIQRVRNEVARLLDAL
ncbi:MAG: VCBS repeat-containing protein [Candidatus Hydrogenedentes bacterium]|nr:VCBS repeat-containing protein [Candidatus Hydrogenedentota bacterium]